MKIGVAGIGQWGQNIARTLQEMGRLSAVADLNLDRAKPFVDRDGGLRCFTDFTQLFNLDLDAVVIATPAATHFDLATQALRADLDVFIEKPMTLSLKEARELVALAQKHSAIAMVGHLLLYQPAVAFLKERLVMGDIGRVLSIHQERLNLGRARSTENVLWSLGVHDIAVILNLLDATPADVAAVGQCALQSHIEDDTFVHMKFEAAGGAIQAHLHNSWLWPERRRHLTVVGTEGIFVYDELAQTVTLHRKKIDAALTNVDNGSEVVFKGAGEPLKLEMEHFIKCCVQREEPISSAARSLGVIEVLERATLDLEKQRTRNHK